MCVCVCAAGVCLCTYLSVYCTPVKQQLNVRLSVPVCDCECACVCFCVCLCVCVNVCLCLFVVSMRQTFENIYFSPCDNATFLAQLALPAETEFSIQLSILCSLSPPLSLSSSPSILYSLPFPFYDYFLSPPLFGFYCWLTAAHPVRFAWIGLV